MSSIQTKYEFECPYGFTPFPQLSEINKINI